MAGNAMTEALDLSFAVSKDSIEKPVASGALDLSFASSLKLNPTQTAEGIIRQRDKGGFPQGSRQGQGIRERLGNIATGEDRETNATRNLPELGSEMGLTTLLGERDVPLSMSVLSTMKPVEIVKQIHEQVGDSLSVRPDEAGNIIVSVDGREAILNKPGFSTFDAMQLGGLMAAFMPAGGAAAGASTIKGGMAMVGGASAATQAGIETLQASQGGDFDGSDVAATGLFAGGMQGLFQKVAQSFPLVRKAISDTGITDDIRRVYRETAVKLGMNADDVTDDVIRASVDDAGRAVAPDEGLAVQGEREFGIPLTQGQRSMDDAALSFEDRARAGMAGDKAQRIVRGFEKEKQLPAVAIAREAVEGRIAAQPAGRAGAVISEGVRDAEKLAAAAVDDAYQQVGNAELTVKGMRELLRNVKGSVRAVEFDKTLPETAKLIEGVNKYQGTIKALEGKGLRDFDLQRIEQMRRRFNTAAGAAQGSDKRQVMVMKRAFDDYLDTAVQNALFSGDDTALASLKSARGLFSEYAKKFRANPIKGKSGRVVDGDEAGKFIEKIVDANPTDEQVVNAIFGASGVNKTSGVAMARRFREVLGDDSEGWSAVRSEAVRRLIQTTKVNGDDIVSGSKTLTEIDKAVNKNGTMLRELFSKEEISLLRRFAVQVKRTQPDLVKSRENPSGTAQTALKAVSELTGRVSTALGLATGNTPLILASTGVKMGKMARDGTKAAQAVRPFEQLAQVKTGIIPATIAAEQAN